MLEIYFTTSINILISGQCVSGAIWTAIESEPRLSTPAFQWTNPPKILLQALPLPCLAIDDKSLSTKPKALAKVYTVK